MSSDAKDEAWRAFGGPGILNYQQTKDYSFLMPPGGPGGAPGADGGDGGGGGGEVIGLFSGSRGVPRSVSLTSTTTATNTSPQLGAGGVLFSSSASSSSSNSGFSAASKPFVPRQQQQVQLLLQQHLSPSPALTSSSVNSTSSIGEAPLFMLPPPRPGALQPQVPQPDLAGLDEQHQDTAALCLQMASSCLLQEDGDTALAAPAAWPQHGPVEEEEEDDDDVVGLAMEAALDQAYLLLDGEDEEEELEEDPFFLMGGHGLGGGMAGMGASSLDFHADAGMGGGYMGGFYGGGYGEAGYGDGPHQQQPHHGMGMGMGFARGPPHRGGYAAYPYQQHGPQGHAAAAVGVLLECFPQCAPRALLVALRRCEFDIEAAARCVEAALRPAVPPCRYYLAGFCARSDCQFSHEVSHMPCTYWLMGSCRDPKEGPTPEGKEPPEGSCCFLHDFPPMPAPPTPPLSALTGHGSFGGGFSLPPLAAGPPAASQGPTINDEEEFPALSLQSAKPTKGADTATATAAATATTSAAAGTGVTTTPAPGKSFLQVALSKPAPSATATATAAGAASSSGLSSSSGGVKTVNLRELVSRQKLAAVWVMGGEEVRRQYQRAREEAGRAAQARNRLFMQATEAFQRGDKAAAKALGEEGRNMNALMRARHRQAALAIFATRNPSDARIYEDGIVDLHGLHVQEAIEMLTELLPDIFRTAGGVGKEVLVITGTGRHSTGAGAGAKHQSRLFPALDDHFREVAAAMARRQNARANGHGNGGGVSAEAAAAALFSHVADPAGHKGGFRLKVNRRLMEHWNVEL